mmetsp:Transcript_153649/g.492509  ORF Transcript_153649/g.492509 Transcript_153649/m.492509 type:complete len:88 (-) Transcript_153649:5-268(-)
MGVVEMSLFSPPNAQQHCSSAAFAHDHGHAVGKMHVDCLWSAKASVYDVAQLKFSSHATCVWIVFEVLPSTPPRPSNKVKLIDITIL